MDWFIKTWADLLPGEKQIRHETLPEGNFILTNFRLRLIKNANTPKVIFDLPLPMILRVSLSETKQMVINTKIGPVITFSLYTNANVWFSELQESIKEQSTILTQNSNFAFSFRNSLYKQSSVNIYLKRDIQHLSLNEEKYLDVAVIRKEYKRMQMDLNRSSIWEISDENKDYNICSSYPRYHILPKKVDSKSLVRIAAHRFHRRFPSITWRSIKTGAVLVRTSQPCSGFFYSRNEEDENLVDIIASSCRDLPGRSIIRRDNDSCKMLIVDARSNRSAIFNRIMGGGTESIEYYPGCRLKFMNLVNIHAVQASFDALIDLLTHPVATGWLSALENTQWLQYLGHLISASTCMAISLVEDACPIMVHCTDGWDRTAQLCALTKLLADPFYRTIQGFIILVQREFLDFGHKFADRCRNPGAKALNEERSPVFLQFLDCVHQVLAQFPHQFEFNEQFLVKMGLHAYSGQFGNFLCNNDCERSQLELAERTCSLWALLSAQNNWTMLNHLYQKPSYDEPVIKPQTRLENLRIWQAMYRHGLQLLPEATAAVSLCQEDSTAPENGNSSNSCLPPRPESGYSLDKYELGEADPAFLSMAAHSDTPKPSAPTDDKLCSVAGTTTMSIREPSFREPFEAAKYPSTERIDFDEIGVFHQPKEMPNDGMYEDEEDEILSSSPLPPSAAGKTLSVMVSDRIRMEPHSSAPGEHSSLVHQLQMREPTMFELDDVEPASEVTAGEIPVPTASRRLSLVMAEEEDDPAKSYVCEMGMMMIANAMAQSLSAVPVTQQRFSQLSNADFEDASAIEDETYSVINTSSLLPDAGNLNHLHHPNDKLDEVEDKLGSSESPLQRDANGDLMDDKKSLRHFIRTELTELHKLDGLATRVDHTTAMLHRAMKKSDEETRQSQGKIAQLEKKLRDLQFSLQPGSSSSLPSKNSLTLHGNCNSNGFSNGKLGLDDVDEVHETGCSSPAHTSTATSNGHHSQQQNVIRRNPRYSTNTSTSETASHADPTRVSASSDTSFEICEIAPVSSGKCSRCDVSVQNRNSRICTSCRHKFCQTCSDFQLNKSPDIKLPICKECYTSMTGSGGLCTSEVKSISNGADTMARA